MFRGFSVIVAFTRKRGIGKDGSIPWPRLADDMAHFVKMTKGTPSEGKKNVVIMGRKTWDSIPAKFKPFKDRYNVIISSQLDLRSEYSALDNVISAANFDDALSYASNDPHIDEIFVIGGGQVYAEAFKSPYCQKVYTTEVLNPFDCDVYFPYFPTADYEIVDESEVIFDKESNVPLQFISYKRKNTSNTAVPSPNPEEQQYLDLIRRVITDGTVKGDRTGTGTVSLFGAQLRFSLRDGNFPLLTTKRVFWRGVAEELFWFINGSTNVQLLKDKNVHIWDGNASREFLDKYGHSARQENDIGPCYGHQWRHFGASYIDCHADYSGKGVDQLAEVINRIKTNPECRRIIMSAWNPVDLNKMALPPCHVMCQFYVANGELSCQMYQRSCDIGLGVPFNIASYALLTIMIAKITGLKPGDFIHTMGDAHVYSNHIEPLKEQIERIPRQFPKLVIKDREGLNNIDDFKFDDFELIGYNPDKPIKMDMAV